MGAPGRGHTIDPKLRVKSSNMAVYLCNRIARDRPDILARMQAGEFKSIRSAAIEAGIITPASATGLTLPAGVRTRLVRYADQHQLSEAEALARLVRRGLEAEDAKQDRSQREDPEKGTPHARQYS